MSAALASDRPPRLYDVAKAFDVLRHARWQPSDRFLLSAAQWLDQRTAGGCSIPDEDLQGNAMWCLRTLLFSWTAFALRSVRNHDSAACRTLPRAHYLLFACLDTTEPEASNAARQYVQMSLSAELRTVWTVQAMEDAMILTGPQWNLQNTLAALRQLKDMCALRSPVLALWHCWRPYCTLLAR